MQVLFCVEEAASDVHLFLYVGCSMNLLLRKMSTGAALVKKIWQKLHGKKELDPLYSLVNQDGNRKPGTSISHTLWTI